MTTYTLQSQIAVFYYFPKQKYKICGSRKKIKKVIQAVITVNIQPFYIIKPIEKNEFYASLSSKIYTKIDANKPFQHFEKEVDFCLRDKDKNNIQTTINTFGNFINKFKTNIEKKNPIESFLESDGQLN